MADVIEPEKVHPLTRKVKEYVALGEQISLLKTRQEQVRDDLLAIVEMEGDPDENGHRYLELPEVVGDVYGLQRQKRETRSADDDVIERVLRAKGLYDRVAMTVTSWDQTEIEALVAEEKLNAADIDAMFPVTRTSHAFVPQKVKAKKQR